MTGATTMGLWGLVLLVLGLVLGAAGECPQDYIHLGEECYYFGVEEFTRDDAESFCGSLGGYLASFGNCSHFISVSRYLEIAGLETGGRDFWLGASREAEYWAWTESGQAFPYGAPYWSPFNRIENEDQACAVMESTGGYLKPAVCTDLKLPMCEAVVEFTSDQNDEDERVVPRPLLTCPSPFEVVGERCIYLNHDFLTWDAARDACIALAPEHFTDLAVLPDCDTFAAIARHMESQQGEVGLPDWAWVGARDDDGDGIYRWLNGDYTDPGVPFWCPGQPNMFEGHQSCVMLWGTNFFYGADEDCNSIHKSLCEVGF